MRSLVENGLSVYEVNAEALEKLKPDVILTQDQCEVCAVSLADVERAVCQFVHGQPKIVSMRPHTLADIYSDIVRVAEAIGRPEAGEKLIASMQDRFAAIAAKVAGRPKKKLAFIEWVEPPMSGGHWMPELIDIAGGTSVFGATGEPSPWITWKEVAAAKPDVILVAPCGYDIEVTAREVRPARPLRRSGNSCARCAITTSSSPTATPTSIGPGRVSSRAPKSSPRFCIPTFATSVCGVRATSRTR